MKRKSVSNSIRNSNTSSEEKESRYLQSAASSAASTLVMVDRCLLSHDIGVESHKTLLKEVVKELSPLLPKEQIVPQNMLVSSAAAEDLSGDDEVEEENSREHPRASRSSMQVQSSKKATTMATDAHNELCEVCDLGGDLLCCDTCTLVFHKRCLRPVVPHIPKGKWSCPHCVVDGSGQGNVSNAKHSITRMRLLSCGFDYADPITEEVRFPSDVSIVRANRQYVARKVIKGLLVEYGRYYELEEAFLSLLQKEPEEERDESCESLWCTECLDNPNITICIFCGCKVCYGKFDSKNLLICDGCEKETHTYCLETPISKIPDSSWYCSSCVEKKIDMGNDDNSNNSNSNSNSSSSHSNNNNTNVRRKTTSKVSKDSSDQTSVNSAVGAESGGGGDTMLSSKMSTPVSTTKGQGRGRPPLSSNQSSSTKSAKDINRKSLTNNNITTLAQGSTDSKFWAAPIDSIEMRLSKFEGSNEDVLQQLVPRGIVGPKDVVTIIRKMAFRELTYNEQRCLNYFRDWAMVSDIEMAIEMMSLIKEALAKRIAAEDPSFESNTGTDDESSRKKVKMTLDK